MPTHSPSLEAAQRPLGLHFVIDVLNEPPHTVDDLQRVVRRHHGPYVALSTFDRTTFIQAVESVRTVFAAPDDTRASTAINALLAKVPAPTTLQQLDDGRWVLRPAVAPSSPASWFTATAAFGLGMWMTERGRAAWGVCAAPDCTRAFIDAGRRAPQQYCGTRCATRARVSAYRENTRSQQVKSVSGSTSGDRGRTSSE